jgi:hypothetical protein
MPYFVNPDLITPPPETVIWRYMDVLQFLTMLEQHALYFALLRELEDAWEAVLSNQLKATLTKIAPEMPILVEALSRHAVINCWHENRSESVAMWNLYTSESHGIAIQTTVGHLIESLKGDGHQISIGRVTYEDHDRSYEESVDTLQPNSIKAIFQKRECYRHESEVRAMIYIMDFPADPVPGKSYRAVPPDHGILINVDLTVLIERVVVSASFPGWGRAVLMAAMKKAGLSSDIHDSAMLQEP